MKDLKKAVVDIVKFTFYIGTAVLFSISLTVVLMIAIINLIPLTHSIEVYLYLVLGIIITAFVSLRFFDIIYAYNHLFKKRATNEI
jgi:hypothetical protein